MDVIVIWMKIASWLLGSHPLWSLCRLPLLRSLPEDWGQPVSPRDEGLLRTAAANHRPGQSLRTEDARCRRRSVVLLLYYFSSWQQNDYIPFAWEQPVPESGLKLKAVRLIHLDWGCGYCFKSALCSFSLSFVSECMETTFQATLLLWVYLWKKKKKINWGDFK